jgi:hypothetical protein
MTTLPAGMAMANDSPVVEGMLRMMETFGFIDRDRLPMGVPYLPSASGQYNPFANLPGTSGMMSGAPMSGMTMIPGGGMPGPMGGGMPGPMAGPMAGQMSPFNPGMGSWPGVPWAQGATNPGAGVPWSPGGNTPAAGLLDGIWELNTGHVAIIRADSARLYVARDQYQDYLIRYDDSHFWWRPRDGSKFERYRYEMREGRMVLANQDGRLLLLRRRQ